jgi:hypothetical protein
VTLKINGSTGGFRLNRNAFLLHRSFEVSNRRSEGFDAGAVVLMPNDTTDSRFTFAEKFSWAPAIYAK